MKDERLSALMWLVATLSMIAVVAYFWNATKPQDDKAMYFKEERMKGLL